MHGSLELPGDKSISHRALMLAAIAHGPSTLHGALDSEDCRATAMALRRLGVEMAQPKIGEWQIEGRGFEGLHEPDGPLDLGNSGTSMRLFCGLLAGRDFSTTLIGDASLSNRPMERVAAPLRAMGAHIDTDDGHAPLQIHANATLQGITHCEPVASAQVKSAILLAGLQANGSSSLVETAPSRDHTERMLPAFGAHCAVDGNTICIDGGQSLHGANVAIPRDLSAAAFFIVAACITPDADLHLPGVGLNPRRDGVLRILRAMGANIEIIPDDMDAPELRGKIRARHSALTGVTVDPALVPNAIDEFPILCIAAACAKGVTEFHGIGELRLKESDRITAMEEGLRTLGIAVKTGADFMHITGGRLRGGTVQSHQDHRIAMAFAIASLAAEETIQIDGAHWVATSFPNFANLARNAGLLLRDG